MNRREMLKVSGAGILSAFVPTWFLHTRPKAIDLAKFCDPHPNENARFYFGSPLAQEVGDTLFSFGTDGKICVRVAGDRSLLGDDESKRPPVSRLSWDHDDIRGWKPWPRYDPIIEDDAICLACRNVIAEECEPCGGTGNVWTGNGYDEGRPITCGACHGRGIKPPHCRACRGFGRHRGPSKQAIGHAMIDPDYDQLIRRECGECEYVIQPRPEYANAIHGQHDLVFFRCEAGLGLLVAMAK